MGVSIETGREPLNLAVDTMADGLTAVYIVVGELGTDDHVLYIDVVAIASGTASGDDYVGFMNADHLHCLYCGVYLADTTFLKDNLVFWE
jgi:hypothetical protein